MFLHLPNKLLCYNLWSKHRVSTSWDWSLSFYPPIHTYHPLFVLGSVSTIKWALLIDWILGTSDFQFFHLFDFDDGVILEKHLLIFSQFQTLPPLGVILSTFEALERFLLFHAHDHFPKLYHWWYSYLSQIKIL